MSHATGYVQTAGGTGGRENILWSYYAHILFETTRGIAVNTDVLYSASHETASEDKNVCTRVFFIFFRSFGKDEKCKYVSFDRIIKRFTLAVILFTRFSLGNMIMYVKPFCFFCRANPRRMGPESGVLFLPRRTRPQPRCTVTAVTVAKTRYVLISSPVGSPCRSIYVFRMAC